MDRTTAQAFSLHFSPRKLEFAPRAVCVGFMVNKVLWNGFFVQVFSFRFCAVNCHFISTPYPFGYHLRMDIGPIGGHSFTQMYLHSTTKDRKK